MTKTKYSSNSCRLLIALALVFSLGIALLAVPSRAEANGPTVVWVDDDFNPTTPTWGTTHFDSIQDGVDAVAEGGTVYVAAGVYIESVYIGKPLSLIGAGSDVVDVYAYGGEVFYVDSDYVNISGFFISLGFWAGIYLDGVQGCNIFDNYLYNNYDGIEMVDSSDNTIRNNIIWDNTCDGIWMDGSSQNRIEENDIAYNYNEWSCPFVYSWDGQEYVLDSQLLNNAPKQEAEKFDYDKLELLEPSVGVCRLKLTAELDETVYINELKLIPVDHPIGTQIIPDKDGIIHLIQSPNTPISAKELDGTPCLNKVKEQDGIYWTSNLDNKDFSQDKDLRDGIILRFNKPVGVINATVAIRFKNSKLPELIHAHFGRLPGDGSPKWHKLQALLHFMQLEVWNGTNWVVEGPVRTSPGSWSARDAIISLNVPAIATDNILRIKLTSLTGLVLIDSVFVDYTAGVITPEPPLSATTAVDADGVNIAPEILADDDAYFVMEQGDYAYLTFNETALDPGYDRSYVAKAKGYYESPHVSPLAGEIPEALIEQFLDDFNYAMRYHLERYRAPTMHCGIYIDYLSASNSFSRNLIHHNYGDGIYLYFADWNDIIDNEIYANEYSGICLYSSDDTKILCNDIYENGWYKTGIYLNWDSWNNIIHWNNIINNAGDGVSNDNSEHWVEATQNWWGCSGGPGSLGCDTVSGYVSYGPWLTEECKLCPLYNERPSPGVPSVSLWGGLALAGVLGLLLVYMLRRGISAK